MMQGDLQWNKKWFQKKGVQKLTGECAACDNGEEKERADLSASVKCARLMHTQTHTHTHIHFRFESD